MITKRVKKSVRVDKDKLKTLKNLASKYDSMTDAAEGLGIERGTLTRVLDVGRCNSLTLERINQLTA